jgi:hypothetical protein
MLTRGTVGGLLAESALGRGIDIVAVHLPPKAGWAMNRAEADPRHDEGMMKSLHPSALSKQELPPAVFGHLSAIVRLACLSGGMKTYKLSSASRRAGSHFGAQSE